ncbi:MAG: hypothetical protein IJ629_02520 [Clostridia bacterium]|nr:hypothetical protein [Clostridia bacterium]
MMEKNSLVVTREEQDAMRIVKVQLPVEQGKRIDDYLETAGRGFAKLYLGQLLEENTFEADDMIETFFASELRLVKNWSKKYHDPGLDGQCDVRVEMKIPEHTYYRKEIWECFERAMDDILGVKHRRFGAWASGTFWAELY